MKKPKTIFHPTIYTYGQCCATCRHFWEMPLGVGIFRYRCFYGAVKNQPVSDLPVVTQYNFCDAWMRWG